MVKDAEKMLFGVGDQTLFVKNMDEVFPSRERWWSKKMSAFASKQNVSERELTARARTLYRELLHQRLADEYNKRGQDGATNREENVKRKK